MSSNQASSSTSNRWLSNILRPRASSVSVESCLNIHNTNPTTPLDARAILPLVESSQPLAARLKHLKTFADLCKSYRFTHLDNVFFAVQDLLESSMPREARSTVFDFMTACISGQYNDLGMARVTFYSSLKEHKIWEDFGDMYRVLYALCRGGRDISGFEKNVAKLLATWLDMVLQRAPEYNVEKIIDSNRHNVYEPSKILYLCEIMCLMTDIARFKFAMFEEVEVAHMIRAARRALLSSNHLDDIRACMAFADVVVRYRFVPVMALSPFMDMLCVAVMLPADLIPDKAESPWSIYMNLLRSHCAHNAVLTLCRRIEGREQDSHDTEALLANGAVTLLAEAAWGPKIKASVVESYQIPDSVILMYMRRGVQQGNDAMNAKILECLTDVVQNDKVKLTTMEWATVWEILDFCTLQIITSISDEDRQALLCFPTLQLEEIIGRTMVHQLVRFLTCIYNQYTQQSYQGPVDQFMGIVYKLRQHLSSDASWALLTYYETEHLLLPSADGWLERILELAETFYIPTNVSRTIRTRVLSMITDVCCAVKEFYPDEVNRKIIYPLVAGAPQESCVAIRQKIVDLIIVGLESCTDEDLFDMFLDIMRKCTSCKCLGEVTPTNDVKPEESKLRRSQSQTHPPHVPLAKTMSKSTTASPLSASSPVVSFEGQSMDGSYCTGIPAMCGLVELFETMDVYLDSSRCLKVFQTILSIANNMDDLLCPYGGPKIVALELLLRLRCEPDHCISFIPDPIGSDNALITLIRQSENNRKLEKKNKDKSSMTLSLDLETTVPKRPRPLKSRLLSYKPEGEMIPDDEVVIPVNDMIDAYIAILSHSSNWDLVSFVLKQLPLQLSNKHLFCGAGTGIEKLRRRVVQWIDSSRMLENVHRLPPTIRRNDLNVHAYNILVVLISYRRFFSKQSQDKIVYAFYMGLRQVTAATKPCIHALTVCCYELPLSVTKMLNEILQRMSQIISVSSVSVHILEFLSGLARLPNLYANFTSDTYKLVFAIALNYLQHSYSATSSSSTAEAQRSGSISTPSLSSAQQTNSPVPGTTATRQQAQRDSSAGASSQTALSQYVLIMAYLVITVWFTAVPLRERRKHVSFIIQRLVSANPIGKSIDEQTFTCIDMLSRFSFADISLSPKKSLVSKILMGDAATDTTPPASDANVAKQNTRSWLYGHTLLTLKTASALGWVEITIRRPSGTVSLMCNVENRVRSEDIDYKTLPALLMMQYTPDLYAARMIQSREEDEETTEEQEEIEGTGLGITFDENTPKAEEEQDKQKAPGVPSDRLLTRRPSITQRALLDLFSRTLSPAVRSNEGTPTRTPSSPQSASTTNRNEDKDVEAEGAETTPAVRQTLPESATAETPSQPISLLRKENQSLDPAFLYMQLSNYPDLTRVMEISPPLPDDETTARSIATLDRTPVVDFHKIGVLYVGKGQKNEVEILANTHGSPDYVKLLSSLGHIEPLRGRKDNTGGLDREKDLDGKYAYFWEDQVTKIIFHVATMMPTDLERDPQCNDKKRHIGNDFVTIVYNDSGEDYAFDTLPGHFNFINIVVTPHSITKEPASAQSGQENSFFKVELQRRPDMPEIGPVSDPKLISSQSLPGFVRQMALHANIFAQVQSSVLTKREYVSPWKERLRHIKRVKERLSKANEQAALASAAAASATGPSSASAARAASISGSTIPIENLLDFTRYT